jgi:hypothetical protein
MIEEDQDLAADVAMKEDLQEDEILAEEVLVDAVMEDHQVVVEDLMEVLEEVLQEVEAQEEDLTIEEDRITKIFKKNIFRIAKSIAFSDFFYLYVVIFFLKELEIIILYSIFTNRTFGMMI